MMAFSSRAIVSYWYTLCTRGVYRMSRCVAHARFGRCRVMNHKSLMTSQVSQWLRILCTRPPYDSFPHFFTRHLQHDGFFSSPLHAIRIRTALFHIHTTMSVLFERGVFTFSRFMQDVISICWMLPPLALQLKLMSMRCAKSVLQISATLL